MRLGVLQDYLCNPILTVPGADRTPEAPTAVAELSSAATCHMDTTFTFFNHDETPRASLPPLGGSQSSRLLGSNVLFTLPSSVVSVHAMSTSLSSTKPAFR